MIVYLALGNFYVDQINSSTWHVLTYKDSIWDFSPALKDLGFHRGSNLKSFQKQYPQVEVLPISLKDYEDANAPHLAFCESWTEEVELDYPHSWYCRLPSFLSLDQFIASWEEFLHPKWSIWGAGESKILAKLGAHGYRNTHINLEQFHRLPIRHLGPDTLPLQKLGIHTLGELASFSLDTLSLQIGSKAKNLLRLAMGIDLTPFTPKEKLAIRWQKDFSLQGEFTCVEGEILQQFLTKGCLDLSAQLTKRSLTTRTLRISWQENENVFTQKKTLSMPSSQATVFLRLLANSLPPYPINFLQLEALELAPQNVTQLQMFTSKSSTSSLEQLKKTLGPALTLITLRRRDKVLALWKDEAL